MHTHAEFEQAEHGFRKRRVRLHFGAQHEQEVKCSSHSVQDYSKHGQKSDQVFEDHTLEDYGKYAGNFVAAGVSEGVGPAEKEAHGEGLVLVVYVDEFHGYTDEGGQNEGPLDDPEHAVFRVF